MQEIIITDTNVLVQLAIILKDTIDLNELGSVFLYVPKEVMTEIANFKKSKEKNKRLREIINWIHANINVSKQLDSKVSEQDITEQVEFFQDMYDLEISNGNKDVSDPPSRTDTRLFCLAKKTATILSTNEGSLLYFTKKYHSENKAMSLGDLLIFLCEREDIDAGQLQHTLLANLEKYSENLRKDDKKKLNKFFSRKSAN